MQLRRQPAAPALAIALPNNNPLPRRTSSILSATSPHTPRSCNSPNFPSLYLSSGNRKSTDSWSSLSSSYGDEEEWEWKPEQLRFLLRTLDALPEHLMTPFNGPVPPSNLLDKIARGVSQAKGAEEWPHSIRQTRIKLVELARDRDSKDGKMDSDKPEATTGTDYFDYCAEVLRPSTHNRPKRPPYRESSMDFMTADILDLRSNDDPARTTHRLQRRERLISTPAFRPYTRPNKSPPPSAKRLAFGPPPTQKPSAPRPVPTPTTIPNATRAPTVVESQARPLRRTVSSISTISTVSSASSFLDASRASDLRIRRTESFCAPSLSTMSATADGRPHSFKRAPSFGTVAGSYRKAADAGVIAAPAYPSSDEEEKKRSTHAKKAKRTSKTPSTPSAMDVDSSPGTPGHRSSSTTRKRTTSASSTSTVTAKSYAASKTGRKARANLQRNPSILGDLLPQQPLLPPLTIPQRAPLPAKLPVPTPTATTATTAHTVSATNAGGPPENRTLRRSRAKIAARRISFGSVVAPDQDPEEFEAGLIALGGEGLGSAFQMS